MQKEYSAGIIIYFDDVNTGKEKFLILKHRKGHWSFPKGHIENGEDIKTAAVREVKEETGLDGIEILRSEEKNKNDKYMLSENYIIKDTNIEKTNYYFIGKVPQTYEENMYPKVKIDVDEILDYRWCNYEEASNLITFNQARELLKNAYEIIKRNKNKN